MNKESVIAFFDRLAPDWDANMIRDDQIINTILDYADITEGISVLDTGCGTGVLIPDYLARGAKKIVGVDISPAMIAIARAKYTDPRVAFINGDVETICFSETFDRCVVYNAFPHFPDPDALIEALSGKLRSGGRLTVAHGMSRDMINARHAGDASPVSRALLSETELATVMKPFLQVDVVVANDRMYVVSGVCK